jgi:predicted PurR-regulated permease PerM
VVLRPFLPAILWAVILAIATWPLHERLRAMVGGRAGLAASLMTLLLASTFVIPLAVVVSSLAEDGTAFFVRMREWLAEGPPPPPAWLGKVPLLGEQATAYWQRLAQGGAGMGAELGRHLGTIKDTLVVMGAGAGRALIDILLSVFTAFFIYRDGAEGLRSLHAVLQRVAGDRAGRLLGVAQGTLKGVVYGIIGTAIIQGILAWLGLAVAGVPGALFLGVVTAFLSLIPMGPPLVWGGAAAWLFYQGETGWGIFMVLWGALLVSSVDNVLKPLFISRGANLPILLVFLGAFGGVIAFGFLGIFLGPTLLAISYTLVREWTHAVPLGEPGPAVAEQGGARSTGER